MTALKSGQNPLVIVTGAGGGIGMRVARRLAAESHDLLLIDKSQGDLDRCQQELADCSVAQRYLQIDFEDASLIKTRLGAELSRGDSVAGLAYVAGFLDPQMLYRRAFELTCFAGAAFVVDEEGEGSGLVAVTRARRWPRRRRPGPSGGPWRHFGVRRGAWTCHRHARRAAPTRNVAKAHETGQFKGSSVLESATLEAWDRHFAVNVRALLAVIQATIPHMTDQRGGAIVAVTSNAANIPRSGMGAYAASKAAAQTLMKCLGLEVASRGIRCNTIAPGSTQTPMLTALWGGADRTQQTLEGDPEAFRVGIPLRRLATPDDIANGVAFLLSEQARHITLQTLTIDGGASLGV